MIRAAVLLASLALALPVQAQSGRYAAFSLGGALEPDRGVAVSGTLGAQGGLWRLGGSMDLITGPSEEGDRYYWDTFSNGQTRCRDSATGQFASDARCTNLAFALRGEALVRLLRGQLVAGAGFRGGNESMPYGTAAWEAPGGNGLFLKASAGDGFVQIDVGMGTGWNPAPRPPRSSLPEPHPAPGPTSGKPSKVGKSAAPSTPPSPTAPSRDLLGEERWIGWTMDGRYYWHECQAARAISGGFRKVFFSREEAERAGFQPTTRPECQGPTRPQPAETP